MELKQSLQVGPKPAPQTQALGDVANHLADIELKIDHLIESIHDSLYRLNQGRDDREESP